MAIRLPPDLRPGPDWPRAADPERIDAALQFHERPHMLAVMQIKIEHVPLVEIGVPQRLLSPIAVSNLFPNFASFAPIDRNQSSRPGRS